MASMSKASKKRIEQLQHEIEELGICLAGAQRRSEELEPENETVGSVLRVGKSLSNCRG